MRKIIHIDMDAFYASIEQRDDATLRGIPIAVGGSGRRGVVMTASYEARRFGVRSAMPTFKAFELCPNLLVVPPRFDAYKSASRQLRGIFFKFTSTIEPLSLDEAYLDVTEPLSPDGSATLLAEQIRHMIKDEIGITASAGVSFNKFLAKLASDMNKPDGQFVIRPGDARTFLAELPIQKFHGVGPATAKKLKSANIHFGRDLQQIDERTAQKIGGSAGLWFRQLANGEDERPVTTSSKRKSVSVETTFYDDILELDTLSKQLIELADDLARRCRRADFRGRTLTVKLKQNDFQLRTRSQTLNAVGFDAAILAEHGIALLRSRPIEKPIRLLGLGVSRNTQEFSDESQLDLPLDESDHG